MLIDTHCHLEMKEFDKDRDEAIKRAKDAGIEYVINISSDIESNLKNLALIAKHPNIYCSIGVHPHDAKTLTEEVYAKIREWAKNPKVVAIGEIGLDYHYLHSQQDIQIRAFKRQIDIARDCGLPVIVHSREAKEDTMRILKEDAAGIKGVLHCFSGDMDMAKEAMNMGFYIPIAGPVTFKKAEGLKEIARLIPDEYLLIETDAPFLSPVPMRGKRNEPAFLRHTAQAIAELRGVTLSDIGRITTLNVRKLFKIGGTPVKGEIAYQIRDSLYLNITNRCTSRCGFCVRFHTQYVKGHYLHIEKEPTIEEIISAIGDPKKYKEVVFCGLGEPLLRLDAVKEVSKWIKQNGGTIRINTNGHGNLINGRDILPELQGLVDTISISLDAEDDIKYEQICKPVFKDAFQAVLSFIKEAKEYIPKVRVTVVRLPEVDIKKCENIADKLGVELKVRELDVVG
ncbi:MAG: YchF/TatD family DNA exonuclease [Nitrospirae bacterium]|nr:YchF/TatD family DNA exonuclease [Nitrospirota bacterium]